jgi:hypothetical protein
MKYLPIGIQTLPFLNKNIMILRTLIVLLLATNFCTAQEIEEFKKDNVILKYPKSWMSKEDYYGSRIFIGSYLTDSTDKFSDNVNLFIQDLSKVPQDIDLKIYVEITLNQIKTLVSEGVLITSEPMKLHNRDGHLFSYTGKQGDFKLKWKQFVFIDNKKAYILTYTAEQTQYNTFLSVADEILNSFELK